MRIASRRWLDYFAGIYAVAALCIALLIARGIVSAVGVDAERVQQDARRNAEATANALDKEIASVQHRARLFVVEKREFLARVMAAHDPSDHLIDLDELTDAWFPGALAFIAADAGGKPHVSHFKGGVCETCMNELRSSLQLRHIGAPYHSKGRMPHIDITVPLDEADDSKGLFLVGFTTPRFATALAIPADARYRIDFVPADEGADPASRGYPVTRSNVAVRGAVGAEYRARLDREMWRDLVLYVGTFVAFSLLGGFALWRARQRMLLDSAALRQANDELELLAHTDPLTGLRNRRSLAQQSAILFGQASREKQPISLVLIDIDHFKRLNDTLGHAAGDACLIVFGRILGAAAQRPLDCAMRYGGEEFLLCLYGTTADAALRLAAGVAANVRQLPERHADGTPLTFSAGIVTHLPDADESVESLLKRADAALYRAKSGGRDRIEYA